MDPSMDVENGIRLFQLLVDNARNDSSLDKTFSDFLDNREDVQCENAGEGNLNFVYRIYCKRNSEKSIILKHAPPYIKVLGPTFPLSVHRLRIEYHALVEFDKLAPDFVPKPYYFDEENNSLCMEYLSGYNDLRLEIIRSSFNLDIARHLGSFMASVHGSKHSSKLSPDELKSMESDFQNPDLLKLTEEFVFTRPFTSDDTNRNPDPIKNLLPILYNDPDALSTVVEMKSLFLEKKECLVHGDLHTGSVMVKGRSVKVLDAEFAYVGPAALDVGMLLANYLMAYFCHISTPENNDIHRDFAYMMAEACRVTVNTYLENLHIFDGVRRCQYEKNLLTEVAGMAGCEMLRRIIGAGQIADFTSPGVSPLAQADAFESGVRLLKCYKSINTVERLVVVALQLT